MGVRNILVIIFDADYTSPFGGRLWDAIRGGSNRVSILLRGSVANKAAKQT